MEALDAVQTRKHRIIGQPHQLAVDDGASRHEARVAAVEIDQLTCDGGLAPLARVQHVSAFFTGQQGAVDEDVLEWSGRTAL